MSIGWAILLSMVLFILWKTGVLTHRIFWRVVGGLILLAIAIIVIFLVSQR